QYQFSLEDPDMTELNAWTQKIVEKLHDLPELRDVASDQQSQGRVVRLVIDRDTAGRLGITPQQIDDALYDSFGQRQVSTMFTQLNQYHVVMEVQPNYKNDPSDLDHLYLRSAAGGQGPLSQIAHVEHGTAPLAITRQGQFPVNTVSFNLAPRASLGASVDAVNKAW